VFLNARAVAAWWALFYKVVAGIRLVGRGKVLGFGFFCFKSFDDGHLDGVDNFTRSMICIPSGWWVDEQARERIVAAIRSYF
jgi:hypothetical protein